MVWKTIPGYPGYSANSEGHIRNEKTGHVSKGGDAGEYLKVSVYAKGDKKPTLCYVHDLVCRAFHGTPTKGQVVLHKDDNKKNCKPSNLKWGSQSENIKSAYDNGLISKESVQMRDIRITLMIGTQDPSIINPYIDVIEHLKQLGVSQYTAILSNTTPVPETDLYITHSGTPIGYVGDTTTVDLGPIETTGYSDVLRDRVASAVESVRKDVNGLIPALDGMSSKVLGGW